jgi:hypothetical protein
MSASVWHRKLLNCTVQAVFRNRAGDVQCDSSRLECASHVAAVWADATLAFFELGESWFSAPGLLKYFERARAA